MAPKAKKFFGERVAAAAESATQVPYPAPTPGTPRAARDAGTLLRRQISETIPPAMRRVVMGHSRHCGTCGAFTRAGGSCPGLRPRNATAVPLCHSGHPLPIWSEVAP